MSDNKNSFRIEPATISDVDSIIDFIFKLAKTEQFPYPVTVTRRDLEANLFGSGSEAKAFLALDGETVCGFAVIYQTFSTTTGKLGIHLDDLFIGPSFQGKGYGKKFLSYFAYMA